MSTGEPFEPWAAHMERAGARNPRAKDGRVSWGGLARLADVSVSAITNMVYGRSVPSPDTVQKVAHALGVPPQTVSAWLELERPVGGPFQPDEASSLLYDHERTAINDLIRAITRGRGEDVTGNAQHPAPMTTDEPDAPAPAGDTGSAAVPVAVPDSAPRQGPKVGVPPPRKKTTRGTRPHGHS